MGVGNSSDQIRAGGSELPVGDDGKARLLKAALNLFARLGYEAASIGDIADTAGVSRGLIRFHFGSKEDLLRAVEHHVLSELRKIMNTHSALLAEGRLVDALPERSGLLSQNHELTDFIRRALFDVHHTSDHFVEEVFSAFEQTAKALIEPGKSHPNWSSLMMILFSMQLGPFAFRPLFERMLGVDLTSADTISELAELHVRFINCLGLTDDVTRR